MPSIINATTTAGVAIQGDNSGSLQLQTNNGTTAVTIDTSQNVGIGTSSPQNGGSFSRVASIYNATNCALSIGNENRHYQWGIGTSISNGLGLYDGTAAAYRMIIDSSGRMTTPSQPYCLVTPPNSFTVPANVETLVSGTWVANTNVGNNFNTSGGIFTAPVTAVYQIVWTVFFNASSASRMDAFIYVNGTIVARKEQQKWGTNSNNNSSQITATLLLAANDQVRFGVYSNSATTLFASGQPWQYASIYLLG